jgi:hypothetical protein
MILPRHWINPGAPGAPIEAGADCCGVPCKAVEGRSVLLWICWTCGATVRQCRGGKRCVLPLGHEALPDFRCHESRSGSQVPV